MYGWWEYVAFRNTIRFRKPIFFNFYISLGLKKISTGHTVGCCSSVLQDFTFLSGDAHARRPLHKIHGVF